MVDQELVGLLRRQFALDWNGIHGIAHWMRVRENGLKLAVLTGARADVVELFALLHDSKRQSDNRDLEHGRRAAQFARELRGSGLKLDDQGFELLAAACRDHSDGLTTGDVTVLTCWDADRLDLGRVGIKPDPAHLCTDAARDPKMIEWAYLRSLGGRELPVAPSGLLGRLRSALRGLGDVMQTTYYIASGFDWKAGDTISEETFRGSSHKTFFLPKIPHAHADNPDYLARRQTELRLEALRARDFPQLPSRRTALFLSKSEEDARTWARGIRNGYRLYALRPVRTKAVCEANCVWYNYAVELHKDPASENRRLFSEDADVEIFRSLKAYWENRITRPARVEILFEGTLRVARRVA